MSFSLLGSISTAKVNTGYANKLQSDRFEDPEKLLCPLWTGLDTYGRASNPDSFVTKNAGCNSAEDRIAVENFLRPQYMEYVTLDAGGFRRNMYSNLPSAYSKEGFAEAATNYKAVARANQVSDLYKIVGSAGYQLGNNNTPRDPGVCAVSGATNCKLSR